MDRTGFSTTGLLLTDAHTHNPGDSSDTISIVNSDPSVSSKIKQGCALFTAGIHPWNISEKLSLSDYSDLFESPKLMGIGETGIDRVCGTDIELQKKFFTEHIELSENLKKPLIIHCVRGASDIVSIHKLSSPSQKWMIHGFNGKSGAFELLSKRGFYFSFGEALLFSGSNASRHIRNLNRDRILLETDDSELHIREIYKAAAEILMLDISELRGIIMDNFCRFFGVKDVSQLAGKN